MQNFLLIYISLFSTWLIFFVEAGVSPHTIGETCDPVTGICKIDQPPLDAFPPPSAPTKEQLEKLGEPANLRGLVDPKVQRGIGAVDSIYGPPSKPSNIYPPSSFKQNAPSSYPVPAKSPTPSSPPLVTKPVVPAPPSVNSTLPKVAQVPKDGKNYTQPKVDHPESIKKPQSVVTDKRPDTRRRNDTSSPATSSSPTSSTSNATKDSSHPKPAMNQGAKNQSETSSNAKTKWIRQTEPDIDCAGVAVCGKDGAVNAYNTRVVVVSGSRPAIAEKKMSWMD